MEVKSANDGLLTNIEVLELLQDVRQKRGGDSNKIELQHRESIEITTINHISSRKISHINSAVVLKCVWAIRKLNFGLTEGEIVQIANLNPASDVEYYLIIEDCNERLSDDQLTTLKEVVSDTFNSSQ